LKKTTKQSLLLLLALVMMLGLLSTTALAGTESPGTVTVRIIGADGMMLDAAVNVADVIDYTTDSYDSSTGINALDAVLYAASLNLSAAGYNISFYKDYGSYSVNEIAGITPSNSDYWGTLAVSSSDTYDGNALSSHAITAGDTYIVYYDKHIGSGAGYGNQSYAWFTEGTAAGTTGSVIPVEAITTGYDASWNTVATALSGAAIYATGPNLNTPTAVAVTDRDGKAYITFADAGTTYTLTLSSDYTYTQCVVTVTGSSVILNDVSINVTDGVNNLSNASLTLSDSSGNNTHSPCEIGSGTYKYRLADGEYSYYASASGYEPTSGTVTVSGTTSQSVPLKTMTGCKVTITPGDTANETVIVRNSSGIAQAALSAVGGVFTYDLGDGNYTYTVSRSGCHSAFGSFTVSGAEKNITTATLTDVAADSAEWPAFRDFSDNMAIVTCPTAQGSWQAEEKWAASLGSLGSWGTLSASNIVLYDGYLYVATEHGLAKIDKSTGEILTTTALSADASYVIQVAYGDGKVFVTTASGIDAFDALTMKLLWSCNDFDTYGSSYMCSTPILYDNGTIYAGNDGCSTYNSIGTYGGYSAIDAATGKVKWTSWGSADTVYYSAGAVLAGKYLVFGGDDGYLRAIDTSTATVNQYYGLITPPTALPVTGKIRASIAYDSGYLYFTTNSGYIYKVSIDSSTGQFRIEASVKFASASSSTPVVYNGRIYVGASDGIYVLQADNLNEISHYAAGASVQTSALLTTAYGGTVYVYFTVNSAQGEIIVLSDDGKNVAYNTLYTPAQNQYSLVSLIADRDGTIYYSNDSGYIFAIQNNKEAKTDLVRTTISVSPASVPITGIATYPTITVKDSNGTEVSTAVPGTYYLAVGSYRYTVGLSGYTNATGTFTVTTDDVANSSKTVSVALSTPSPGPSASTITVTFKLQDVDAAFSKSVTVASGAAVYDVFEKVMDAQGVTYTLEGGSYIKTIDGLSEGDKGAKSGWMYKVNDTHPTVGITNYYVKSGDVIVFHFTDDYTQEEDSFSSDPSITPVAVTSSGSAAVDPAAGGTVKLGSEAVAEIPAGALVGTSAVTVEIRKLSSPPPMPSGFRLLGSSFEFSVDGSTAYTFNQPVTLSFTFDPKELIFGQTPSIYYYDEKSLQWVDLGGTVSGNTISVNVDHFTKYALFAKEMTATPVIEKTFMDVPAAFWASDAIKDLYGRGYISGYPDDSFKPDKQISRAEFVTIITKIFKLSSFKPAQADFEDVASADWFYESVENALHAGIVKGYGKTFLPNQAISREEMAAILVKALGRNDEAQTNMQEKSSFTDDANISNWARGYVFVAARQGLMKGYSDRNIHPQGQASRAEACSMISNFLKLNNSQT
jgi:hypothetical protein